MTPAQASAELRRMAAAAHLVRDQLRAIGRQIEDEALEHVIATVPHPRRSTSTRPAHTGWRALDTAALEAIWPAIAERRRPEIEALQRRLDRQARAIRSMIARHRFNVDPAELLR